MGHLTFARVGGRGGKPIGSLTAALLTLLCFPRWVREVVAFLYMQNESRSLPASHTSTKGLLRIPKCRASRTVGFVYEDNGNCVPSWFL
jgi:hypothetical protein